MAGRPHDRLSKISTIWTRLQADGQAGHNEALAHSHLFERYESAVYRYLLGATRDPGAADELFQEFAMRVFGGRFAGASPEKGRFRDYLRRTLINLVTDHHRISAKRAAIGALNHEPASENDEGERFDASWSEEIIHQTWEALAENERSGASSHYSILKTRVDNRELSSAALAEQLNQALNPSRPWTAAAVRKAVQRAREAFADLLLSEVAASLETSPADLDPIEDELITLGLHPYCKATIAKRRGGDAPQQRSQPTS